MKKSSSHSTSARIAFSILFLLAGIALLCAIPFAGSQARGITRAKTRPNVAPPTGDAGSGSISATGPAVAWNQVNPVSSPGGGVNTEANCVEGVNCEHYILQVTGTTTDWSGKKVRVELNWGSQANEYDVYIHKYTPATMTINPAVVASAASGPGVTSQITFIPINNASDITYYYIHVVFDLNPVAADTYHGRASAVPQTPVPPPSAPQDSGAKIGYENLEPPGVLTPITQSSSGGITYEYMGRNGIEPSVGANWVTGVVNYQSDLETLFVTFDDNCNLANPKATWVNRRAPTSQFVDSDPIGFTDHLADGRNRVFAAELTLLSPDTVKISHTDDDGVTWVGDQSGGVASAVDHETIGAGPYPALLPTPVPLPTAGPTPGAAYPHAVYYCSQDLEAALCSRSDDGGSTYGPSIPIYTFTTCGGLHGHVKVSPTDGTVYVPNRSCGGVSAVVVSQDSGVTWAVRTVQNGTSTSVPSNIGTGDDPALGIDNAGRVYFAFSNAGSAAGVATSIDRGLTWQNIYDVGATYGLQNVAFPAAIGGSATSLGSPSSSDGRAAVAYYGSVTPGSSSNNGSFTGVWHLYVAHTFDGGAHWTTSDLTPQLPMQRSGLLRGGGADIVRNLADFFDIQMDVNGRVIVGYGNGCGGGPCSQAPINPDGTTPVHGNAYSAVATIARQSSGRRLLAANDPAPLAAPGMPLVTQRRVGNVVHLAWNEADPGNNGPNQTISSFQIHRGTTSGAETLLATVAGNVYKYDDYSAADSSKTYYYKVVASNSIGSSCANNEVASPYMGETCTGLVIHRNDPNHPEATGGGATNPPIGPNPVPVPTPPPGSTANGAYLIDYIAVGEPAGSNMLMFKMKVANLTTVPPNSRWRIAWDWWTPTTQLYYVGMTSDSSGNVTFEYGTLADAGVPAVLVLGETKVGNADPASNKQSDGTITIYVPKSGVGNPQPGDLLGAVGGKTIADTSSLERSTTFVDHTFIKGSTDNAFPAATYTIMGNGVCAVQPTLAQSWKTHGGTPFPITLLPLPSGYGVEDRQDPAAPNNHQVIITLPAAPTAIGSIMIAPGQGGTAELDTSSTSGNQVTVNLKNVSDQQLLTINLLGVTIAGNTGDVSVPMGVLYGDVNNSSVVTTSDIQIAQSHALQTPLDSNSFRSDVNITGVVTTSDIQIIQANALHRIP